MNQFDDEERARQGAFDGARLTDRALDELIGLCRGALMDGVVVDAEIVRLDEWCRTYPAVYNTWPGDVLARRLHATLADGLVEDDERAELTEVLRRITGQGADRFDQPTTLPLTRPAPELAIVDECFCLTGTFLFGTRKRCHRAIEEIGGRVEKGLVRRVDYLVVGHYMTPAWIHSTHGRKIEQAVELQRTGSRIKIVAEAHWSRFLLSA